MSEEKDFAAMAKAIVAAHRDVWEPGELPKGIQEAFDLYDAAAEIFERQSDASDKIRAWAQEQALHGYLDAFHTESPQLDGRGILLESSFLLDWCVTDNDWRRVVPWGELIETAAVEMEMIGNGRSWGAALVAKLREVADAIEARLPECDAEPEETP